MNSTDRRLASAPRRLSLLFAFLCLLIGAVAPAPASAAFHIVDFSGLVAGQNGDSFSQAAGHPYEGSASFEFPTDPSGPPDGQPKEVITELPPGLVGNPMAMGGACSLDDFLKVGGNACAASTQVGIARIQFEGPITNTIETVGIYSIVPGAGFPAQFAFLVFSSIPVYLYPAVRSESDYGLTIESRQIQQALPLKRATITFWGTPYDSSHDADRGFERDPETGSNLSQCSHSLAPPTCSNHVDGPKVAFVTNPSNCSAGALTTTGWANEWANPTVFDTASFDTDTNGNSTAVTGCELVPFEPSTAAQATTDQAETPTGLEFDLDMPSDGLQNPDGIAEGHVKKTVVALPRGITVNPSSAEGLGACSPAQLDAETLNSEPGAGCPNGSKLGSVDIETPLLKEHVTGSLYLAQQDDPATATPRVENPFDSLLAIYIVARSVERGVIVKLAGKVELDPETGQLTTTFDDLPQLPFSNVHLKFREGARAPLVTPSTCGIFATQADFVPWSAADPDNPQPSEIAHTASRFQVTRGVGGGSCPKGGLPPFKPNLVAGTINNAAGTYSPFSIRLFRNDGEQEFTNFSIKLPPGIVAKLAGVPFCPDAALEAAKSKSGAAELASSSCPAASEIGRTLVGAGVGSIQTYVPGKIYLAGPYKGSALSVAAITAAKVGPFDVGTVVIRQALKVDPETAEVFIDATGSDPIPHIIDGIPVHARDIRVYVDRANFVLNPTDCDRTSTASTLLGSGLDFASDADNNPITITSPFQAADCAALPFNPKLSLRLIGGTKRGDHPKFRAHLKMAGIGEAAIERAQVTLPKSEFLENANIRTICTRAQFNKGTVPGEACPAASVYGYAKAITPILDEPLTGPVFLRSSEHELPDLVAALHSGKINFNLIGRIDSVKGGGLRNTFEAVPDAPVSEFTLTMQGGKKGLLVNSTNLCKGTHKAKVAFDAHNGKASDSRIPLKAKCKGKAKKPKRAR